jgi:hypothetical protein
MFNPRFFWMLLFAVAASAIHAQESKWWKGNLHTHTFWSDGDDFPDMVANWYKENGYHFLALSDHNIVLEGEKWVTIGTNRTFRIAFAKYQQKFPSGVQLRTNGTNVQVRLANLGDLKGMFEGAGSFLLIPSEEISANHDKKPIHVNVTNIRELITPRGGNSVLEVMQNNIDAVLAQRQRTGQPMFPHLNHPNFHFAVTAEDLMRVQGERFFEVYNGHPAVFNEGDTNNPSTERMWDIVLAWRLAVLRLEPMFGIAVDDSHNYHSASPNNANAGRGWIMVRAPELTPEHIVDAMEAGDFYASSGVRLKSVTRTASELSLEIDPDPNVTYTITFIGTKQNFVLKQLGNGKAEVDPALIGQPLTEPTRATKAAYRLKPDDLYVRALIESSKSKLNGLRTNEVERAWTQPVIRQ